MTRSYFMALLLLALALGAASFFLHQSDYPLTYDEGDYFTAVGKGFWTNWTDADDLPLGDFVSMGIDAVRDPASRSRLSDYIRSAGSTMFHRHYHPPLAFYPPILLAPLTASLPLQWQLRLAHLFWLLLWTGALALLGWRYAEARTPAIILVPASGAWAMAVVGYNMHLPFGLLASLFFLCWYLYEEHGHAGLRRAALLFLAATLATVEYGMFVLFFILIHGALAFWKSGEKTLFLRRALSSAGWVLLFLMLLWPAGMFGLNLLKSWTFVIYIALFRLGGEPAAFAGWWTLLIEKWNANPLELLLLLALLGATLYRWRLLLVRGSLFTATGLLLALLYLQVNPALVYRWYLFPAFAVGFLLLGHVVLVRENRDSSRTRDIGDHGDESHGDVSVERNGERGRAIMRTPAPHAAVTGRRTLVFAGVGVLMFVAAWWLVPEPDYSSLKELHRVVNAARPTSLFIPRSALPQLRHYHPGAAISSYHDTAYPEMSLADSLPRWRARGFVLIPRSIDSSGLRPDGHTTEFWYFLPRTKSPN